MTLSSGSVADERVGEMFPRRGPSHIPTEEDYDGGRAQRDVDLIAARIPDDVSRAPIAIGIGVTPGDGECKRYLCVDRVVGIRLGGIPSPSRREMCGAWY